MTIYFRGGEIRQKGKGIGGFFRGLVNLFKPMVKSAGSSIAKAATSNAAQEVYKTLGEQAIDSTLNMTKDLLRGNDMQTSFNRESENMKRTGAEIIDKVRGKRRRVDPQVLRKRSVKQPKKQNASTLKMMKQKYEPSRRYSS